MKIVLLMCFAFFLISSCSHSIKNVPEERTASELDSLQSNDSTNNNESKEGLNNIQQDIKPVLGYRFMITGDFDGDGGIETLTEHFFSGIDSMETNKFYDGLSDYDDLVTLTMKKNPYLFLSCDNKSIDTLHITSNAQQFGLSYLKNEGDLNGDGTDEISYVVNWADWSNLNMWYIMTYKNKKWKEVYSFSIWDWQLPDLPQTANQYGLFGLEDKIIDPANDSANEQIEQDLLHFEGLVKKIKNNKIQIIFKNDEAELDSMIIDLKRK